MVRKTILVGAAMGALLANQATAQSALDPDMAPRRPSSTSQAGLHGPTTETLFAIDTSFDVTIDRLLRISTDDGSQTFVGSTAPLITPAGLAFDGTDLYTIDLGLPGGLYRLDLNDGTPTLVGNTGINGWQTLASDPTDSGQLYGTTNDQSFYRLSRTDGSATLVTQLGGIGNAVIPFGLEFDADGTLWTSMTAVTIELGFLGTIDKVTGEVANAVPLTAHIGGIDFDSNGHLYGMRRNGSLFSIDTNTGATTLIGTSDADLMKGLAFTLCGNGVIDPNEQCDDNNPNPCDACSPTCTVETEFCGDGSINTECEECDDGNDVDGDDCRNDCTIPLPTPVPSLSGGAKIVPVLFFLALLPVLAARRHG